MASAPMRNHVFYKIEMSKNTLILCKIAQGCDIFLFRPWVLLKEQSSVIEIIAELLYFMASFYTSFTYTDITG